MPLHQAQKLVELAREKGHDVENNKAVKDIMSDMPEEERQEILAEVDQLAPEALPDFDLGEHFDQRKGKMLRHVPPTRQFQTAQVFKHTFFILCFVQDFDGIYDSIAVLEAGETDLSNTLMFKLLTICGGFLSHNEGKEK